jgi:hypothetical protein
MPTVLVVCFFLDFSVRVVFSSVCFVFVLAAMEEQVELSCLVLVLMSFYCSRHHQTVEWRVFLT